MVECAVAANGIAQASRQLEEQASGFNSYIVHLHEYDRPSQVNQQLTWHVIDFLRFVFLMMIFFSL